MVSKKMEEALNKQLNLELYSAYIYASMGACFDARNLSGFSGWMKAQAKEEVEHAGKFYGYINDVNGRVVLQAIDKPQTDWDTPLAAFKDALKHEQHVTASISKLVSLAREENDYATEAFLQWFVKEQVEEESHVGSVVDKLELVGDNPNGLLMMDGRLAQRAG